MTSDSSNGDQPPSALDRLDGLILDFGELLPGDILLFRANAPDLASQRVSAEIGSPYTHAAVYIGNGEIIEAGYPRIAKRQLSEIDKQDYVIGVFRSQLGFSGERPQMLREFADALIGNAAKYDWRGLFKYKATKSKLEEELQEILSRDYGKVIAKSEFEQKSYFCSALVVASYIVAGVIGETAQIAYKEETFSPVDLYEDDTFGWFLGYITADPGRIPPDDPLMLATLWRDLPSERWW